MGKHDGHCRLCGQPHRDGASAIYCDRIHGYPSPSTSDDEQRTIALRFERDRPEEAAAIAD